jgi:hypothetical protein
MSAVTESQELSLNANLVTAVIELIDFYSKKGVFKLSEYKDIASINERLTEVKEGYENDSTFNHLTTVELAFIVQVFREGSQRVPTLIDSFGQLFGLFQHFQKVLEQELEKEKNKGNLPSIEELEK